MLLHIFSYSVFNRSFFRIDDDARYRKLRIILILLFVGLFSTVLVSNVNPLVFITKCRLAYSIIEIILFLTICTLMAFNLWLELKRESSVVQSLFNSESRTAKFVRYLLNISPTQTDEDMDPSPTILPLI